MFKRQIISSLVACLLSVPSALGVTLTRQDYAIFLDSYRESLFDYARGKGLTLHKVFSDTSTRSELWKADEAGETFPVLGTLHGATFLLKYWALSNTDRTRYVCYDTQITLPGGQTVESYKKAVFDGFRKEYGEPIFSDPSGKMYDLGDMKLAVGFLASDSDQHQIKVCVTFYPHRMIYD